MKKDTHERWSKGKFDLTIVIPVLNSTGLERTIEALERQTVFDQVKEIIVAGMQPPGPWQLRHNKVRYMPVDPPTHANNRNLGAAAIQGEWVVFIDSDCLPQPDWLEVLCASIRPGKVVLGGCVDVPSGIAYWGMCDHLFGFESSASQFRPAPGPVKYLPSLNLMVQKTCFDKLGGFDTRFEKAAEDRDFCWRLYQAGFQVELVPAAIVVHAHSRLDFRSTWRHCRGYGVGTVRFWELRGGSRWWQRFGGLVRLPVIGELGMLSRLAWRALARPVRRAWYRRHPQYLPGVAVMDMAFSMGILRAARVKR